MQQGERCGENSKREESPGSPGSALWQIAERLQKRMPQQVRTQKLATRGRPRKQQQQQQQKQYQNTNTDVLDLFLTPLGRSKEVSWKVPNTEMVELLSNSVFIDPNQVPFTVKCPHVNYRSNIMPKMTPLMA